MSSRLMTALFSFAVLLGVCIPAAYADTSSSLQAQADDRSKKISQLQDEITQLQKQLDVVSGQKQTLQSTLQALDLSNKKLTTQITLTQAQINKTDLQITSLSGSIATTSNNIDHDSQGVADTLRSLDRSDAFPVPMQLLSNTTLSGFFDEVTTLAAERDALGDQIRELSSLKTTLVNTKSVAQQKRDELAALKSDLSGQKQALAATIADKNTLLKQTKNQESAFQSLITQKKAQESAFEQELLDFQNQLKGTVDFSTIPHTGSGVLQWPLSTIRVTQYFGNTTFSQQHSALYNGHGHSGVDFAASIGTPIMAAGDGVVMGTGNTDLTCPNASYGKWVLIKHNNGLATLSAHLSVISVSAGQTVSAHQVIGYSGMTGYATGPHLHFGVFAADVVQVSSFASKSCRGRTYTMPVAPLEGYLNPLSFL